MKKKAIVALLLLFVVVAQQVCCYKHAIKIEKTVQERRSFDMIDSQKINCY